MTAHPAAVMLRWIGQACFLIMSMHGARLLIDPPHPAVGYPISAGSIVCNAVFVSHEHFDHNFVAAAAGHPVVIEPMPSPAAPQHGSLPAPGDRPPRIDYTRIFAYHDNVHGAERGPDTMTVLDIDGLRVLHMGDIGQLSLTPAQLEAIGHVDVAMIPVGGFFTVDAKQAEALIEQIKPRIVIPIHYRTPALEPILRAKLAPVTQFESAMAPIANIVEVKTLDLAINPHRLPKRLTVYVMRYE